MWVLFFFLFTSLKFKRGGWVAFQQKPPSMCAILRAVKPH